MASPIISCLIIDDEPIAREALKGYVDQVDFLDLKGLCKNAMEANNLLNQQAVDLLFLDIQMPQMSGMEWLETLKSSPLVVFTTAFSQYAVESYQFDVVDYLLKPVSFQRFLQSVNKAKRFLAKPEGEAPSDDAYIFVKTDLQLVKLKVADIYYVESMQNYILFHTEHERFMTLVPLRQAIEMLPAEQFLQVHKSYMVAKNKVEAIEGNQLVLGNHKVPVSVRMRKSVIDELMSGRLLRK